MQSDDGAASALDASPLYADVLVPRHIVKSFTYRVPAALSGAVGIGRPVIVPFGRGTVEATVVSLSRRPPPGVDPAIIKEIRSVPEGVRDAKAAAILFALSRRVSDEYVAPWGQCLRLIVPRTAKEKPPAPRYTATSHGRAALQADDCPESLRPLLTRIARRSAGISASTLLSSAGRRERNGLDALLRHGWIAREAAIAANRHPRQPRTSTVSPGPRAIRLPLSAQDLPPPDGVGVVRIAEALAKPGASRLLVHAPWRQRLALLAGAIRRVHAMKKSAIVLCGEAAKAVWVRDLLEAATTLPVRLLGEVVTTDVSDQRETGASILVGTRSAVFAPTPSVGLIWVEGEDDPALKEPQEPRYHGRDVAWMRAELESALAVLASAHPSLEAYEDAGAGDCLFHQPAAARPGIEVMDLRGEPPGQLLSRALVHAMEDALARKAGILLFLNRKGYAGALACRDCGWIPRCSSCAVALTYYRESAKLACRYCGQRSSLPEVCSICGAARLNPVGEGTERVEVEVRRLFPQVRIARLDGDMLRRPAQRRRLWEQVYQGDVDVVVGTQALFQREPLPSMGLVGIVQADTGLHAPDFRAAERTYQLLEEAVAAARPAADGGKVVLQTMLPSHHAVEAVVLGEPRRFYDEESAARRLLGYPPAMHLVNLSVSGRHAAVVDAAARQWRTRLEQAAGGGGRVMILGPVSALGNRPRGHHRRHMLVKGLDRAELRAAVRRSVEGLERQYPKGQAKFVVDVDPVEMG